MQQAPTLRREVHGSDCVVVMQGEFDLSWAPSLQGELDSVLSGLGPSQRILLDLTEVTFLDSTALGVLVGAHKAAVGSGGSMALCGATSAVRRLLEITHIDAVMPVYDDLAHAGTG